MATFVPTEFVNIHNVECKIVNLNEQQVLAVGQGVTINNSFEQFPVKGWGSHLLLGVSQGVAQAQVTVNYLTVTDPEFWKYLPSVAGCWPQDEIGLFGWTMFVQSVKCSPMGEGRILRVCEGMYLQQDNITLQPGNVGTGQMSFICMRSYNPYHWSQLAGS